MRAWEEGRGLRDRDRDRQGCAWSGLPQQYSTFPLYDLLLIYTHNTVERHKERSVSATDSTVVIEDLENSPSQKKRPLSAGEQL